MGACLPYAAPAARAFATPAAGVAGQVGAEVSELLKPQFVLEQLQEEVLFFLQVYEGGIFNAYRSVQGKWKKFDVLIKNAVAAYQTEVELRKLHELGCKSCISHLRANHCVIKAKNALKNERAESLSRFEGEDRFENNLASAESVQLKWHSRCSIARAECEAIVRSLSGLSKEVLDRHFHKPAEQIGNAGEQMRQRTIVDESGQAHVHSSPWSFTETVCCRTSIMLEVATSLALGCR